MRNNYFFLKLLTFLHRNTINKYYLFSAQNYALSEQILYYYYNWDNYIDKHKTVLRTLLATEIRGEGDMEESVRKAYESDC